MILAHASSAPSASCGPWAPTALLEAAWPAYPEIAAESGAIGTSEIVVTVDPLGHVSSARITRSAGNAALDEAAFTAAKSSLYEPTACGARTAASSIRFVVDFVGGARPVRVVVDGVLWAGAYRYGNRNR